MSTPKRPDRWDDPDYKPTQAELEEPVTLDDIEDATPEAVARAIMRPIKGPTPSRPD